MKNSNNSNNTLLGAATGLRQILLNQTQSTPQPLYDEFDEKPIISKLSEDFDLFAFVIAGYQMNAQPVELVHLIESHLQKEKTDVIVKQEHQQLADYMREFYRKKFMTKKLAGGLAEFEEKVAKLISKNLKELNHDDLGIVVKLPHLWQIEAQTRTITKNCVSVDENKHKEYQESVEPNNMHSVAITKKQTLADLRFVDFNTYTSAKHVKHQIYYKTKKDCLVIVKYEYPRKSDGSAYNFLIKELLERKSKPVSLTGEVGLSEVHHDQHDPFWAYVLTLSRDVHDDIENYSVYERMVKHAS